MKRKVIKLVAIFLMIFLMLNIFVNTKVQAAGFGGMTVGTVVDNAEDKSGASDVMSNILGACLTIMQVVSTGAAVIMLIVLAIKYMGSAPSERADIKKSATIYITAVIILFAASGILTIIRNFAVKNISAVDPD